MCTVPLQLFYPCLLRLLQILAPSTQPSHKAAAATLLSLGQTEGDVNRPPCRPYPRNKTTTASPVSTGNTIDKPLPTFLRNSIGTPPPTLPRNASTTPPPTTTPSIPNPSTITSGPRQSSSRPTGWATRPGAPGTIPSRRETTLKSMTETITTA